MTDVTTLVFGVCVGPSGKFERIAAPGIVEVAPQATVLTRRVQTSIHSAYNSMIDEAVRLQAQGLVLLHDDVRIRDSAFCDIIGSLLADPTVGVVGVIGACHIQSIDWWWYDCHGFVEEPEERVDYGRGTFDVDVVDGVVMALSPVALRQCRFDPDSYPAFHGYDAEICSQARSKGLRVIVAAIDGTFHDSYPHGKITDRAAYVRADRVWRSRWRRRSIDALLYRYAAVKNLGASLSALRRVVSP